MGEVGEGMSELLNQPQLEHAIDEILYGKHEQPYSKGDALLMLINTQKRLYAESVINSLIEKDAFDEKFELKELIKSIREVMRIK